MLIPVLSCPNCQGTDIVGHGKTRQGQPRSCCRMRSDQHLCDTFGSAALGSSWMQKRLGTGTPLLQRDGIKRIDAICGQL
jgi:hypothetical protein